MGIKKKLALAAAAVAMVTAGGAAPAQAAPGNGSCEVSEICAFRLTGYNGRFADISATDADWSNNYFNFISVSANNRASSGGAVNRAVQLFNGKDFAGRYFYLGVNVYDPHWSTGQVGPYPGFDFDNKVSSSAIYIP